MILSHLLEMLCQDLKIDALPQKDKKGFYQLKINPSIELSLLELDPGFHVYSPIVAIPAVGNKEELFIYIMKANFLGQGTGGSILGIDSTEKLFTLSLNVHYKVTYRMFHNNLEDFVNYLDFWREEIVDFSKKPT